MSTSFDPYLFMRGRELTALLHLVGEGLEVLLSNAAHRSLADSSLCGQFSRRTTGICSQLFSLVFLPFAWFELFSFCSGPVVGCLACLPELLDHFPNRFTPNLKLFCDGRITLTLFTEAYDCFSVYSHQKKMLFIQFKLLKCKADVSRNEMYLQQQL